MKSQILKIAGVKSEKEFYKKYPSEEAFMKVHGKAFKKAQMGTLIGGAAPQQSISKPASFVDFQDIYDKSDKLVTGSTEKERYKTAYDQAMLAAANKAGGQSGGASGIMGGISSAIGMLGGGGDDDEGDMPDMAMSRYGRKIPTAQAGVTFPPPIDASLEGSPGYQYQQAHDAPSGGGGPSMFTKATQALGPLAGPLTGIAQGYDMLRAGRAARKEAQQEAEVSKVARMASATREEQSKRKYVRPEDIQNTGEEFFPIYGVGTNVLTRNGRTIHKAQDGSRIGGNPTEIQNTYSNGYDIYTHGGFTPLNNPSIDKTFREGGYIPMAQSGWDNWKSTMGGGGSGFSGGGDGGGTPWGQIGSMATGVTQGFMGGQNGGGKIGETAGSAVGSIFGPAGSAIGGFVGGVAGNLLDTNQRDTNKFKNRTKSNTTAIALNSGFQGIQDANNRFARNGEDIVSYEDGGYMNPEYNPQVIAMFGDHNAQDFADYAHKDEFRAGGHLKQYTAPSERAMETFAMGGELETHWGGYAEPMSHNPYLPGSGETVMFRGNSHEERSPNGETGIGITYGGNPVEVERGEPMVQLADGGEMDPATGEPKTSGVVFGNLKIPNQYIDLLGDPKAKGMKFKHYVANKSREEDKINKSIDKSTNELNALDINSSFDRLKLSSLEANIKGGNMKLKDIADKKMNAAFLQNAINDTAEENGLVADDLARGKVKIDKEAMQTREARFGATISKARSGITTTTEKTTIKPVQFTSVEQAKKAGYVQDAKGNWYKPPTDNNKRTTTSKESANAMDNIPKQSVDKKTGLFGGVTPEQFKAYKDKNSWYDWTDFDPTDVEDVDKYAKAFNAEAEKRGSKARILPDVEIDPKTKKPIPGTKTKYVGKQLISANIEDVKESEPTADSQEYAKITEPNTTPVKYKRSPWIDLGNQVLDYLRPSDQEGFDYNQTMGEMYALSSNQLSPVQTQSYQPQLTVPYDINLQAQRNAVTSGQRALSKQIGYNPAAQANVAPAAYNAINEINEKEFLANQGLKNQVYTGNVNTMNQANLTNLGILDKQYERQAEALSNTKATTLAALNSISDKYAKQKLENRTLGVYENLYKYRYDNKGRAINLNGLFQPNVPTVGSTTGTQKQVPIYKADGKTIDHYQLEEMTPEEIAAQQQEENYTAVPPSSILPININLQTKTKTKKESRNGSIVKAIKNF